MGRAISAQAFEDLYAATVRDVLAYLRRRTTRDAEDLAAEVYLVAWRRRADLPAPMLRRAWLFGVAQNLLATDRRLEQRERGLTSDLAAQPGPTRRPAADDPAADDPAADVVRAAVGRLKPSDRELLRLTSWEGLTPAEIAVALGVRPATARVRLHRARQALASDPDVRALVEAGDRAGLSTSRCD